MEPLMPWGARNTMSLRAEFVVFAARPVTHPIAHLTTSLTCCVWCMSLISAGGRKIMRLLEDRGHGMPAFSNVHNLIARHGLLPVAAPGGLSMQPRTGSGRWILRITLPMAATAATRSSCWTTTPGSRCARCTALSRGVRLYRSSWSASLSATASRIG